MSGRAGRRAPGSRPSAWLMSVPPPSWVPKSTSTGSASSSVRSTTAVSKTTTRCAAPDRGEHRAEDAGVDDRGRHRAALVEAEDDVARQRGASGRSRPAAPGRPSGAPAGSAAGWRGSSGSSRSRRAAGRRVRAGRGSAPRSTAARVRWPAAARCPSTTLRTTAARRRRRPRSGITPRQRQQRRRRGGRRARPPPASPARAAAGAGRAARSRPAA